MTTSARSYQLGLLFVSIAAVAWSTSGLFTRLLHSVNIPTILFWRGFFGAVANYLTIRILARHFNLGTFREVDGAGYAYAIVTAVSMLLFISALLTTTVAHVAIITATVPFVAAFLAWLFLRQYPGASEIIASCVALTGIAIMVGIGGDGTVFGDGLAIMMAFCMGGMIVISRRFGSIPALPVTCIASVLSALATLPFASMSLRTSDLLILFCFAMVNQVLGFGLFAIGARLLPPMETALITALDAPLAPLWVWLFLSETPARATVLGGGVVFLAVVAHILKGRIVIAKRSRQSS